MAELATGFACQKCGERHETLPLSFSVKAPFAVTQIPACEMDRRVVITPDQCVIDDTMFFVRGRIVVPVQELQEPFIWGVWAQVTPKTFYRTHLMWNAEGREREEPHRGWMNTSLPFYGNTLQLEVRIQTQVVGRRPHFEIVSEEHPLGREQRSGITLARLEEIASLLLH